MNIPGIGDKLHKEVPVPVTKGREQEVNMAAMQLPVPAPQLPETVYVVFSGEINQESVQRIINAATNVMAQGVRTVHLLFQSGGGYISDGICLYNFFKALTLDVSIYNGGGVSSMAAIAFLGIPKRRASKYGTFMIHRSHRTMEGATAAKLEEAAASLRIDD